MVKEVVWANPAMRAAVANAEGSLGVHPAARTIREMTDAEYAALKHDIGEHGLNEPIKLCDGDILDGRHRLRVCGELGIVPAFEAVATNDPYGYVQSANVARRHLSEGERALEAAAKATRTQADHGNNIGKFADVPPTQAEAALRFNVSERQVRKAKAVLKNPAISAKVESGEMSLHQAEKRVRRIAREAKIETKHVEMEAAPTEYAVEIRRCSCAELGGFVDDGSVDLIVTDPPYAKKFLPVWRELGDFAIRALRPGGFLVSMTSTIFARESEDALMAAGMRLWPRMVYELRGAKDCIQYGRLSFISEAKFLIVASNGALPEPVSIDSNLVRIPFKSLHDNARHECEQSVGGMGEICKRFMKRPGMVLCDPFLGSGTTFEAAKAFKPSRMIGCDIDADHCRKAEDRLAPAHDSPLRTALPSRMPL